MPARAARAAKAARAGRSPKQLGLAARGTRGGYRANAGRRRGRVVPPSGRLPPEHLRRPSLSRHTPVHVTLRLVEGLPTLRHHRMWDVLRARFLAGRERFGFRLVELSVQSNHLHLMCEGNDRRALSRGMQGLAIRLAKGINKELGRRGKVFAERYHARQLRSPSETRNALRYVLGNYARHISAPPGTLVDVYSTAPRILRFRLRFAGEPEILTAEPRSWLLRRERRRIERPG